MITWKALLLIYTQLQVALPNGWWRKKKFDFSLSEEEVRLAINSFHQFPALAAACSQGEAQVTTEIFRVPRILSSLTQLDAGKYWPSPTDTASELDTLAPPGAYDSIFIFWPQHDSVSGQIIPTGGWGLGMGGSAWTNFATYATVTNASPEVWQRPMLGEVWLHEWLHGVCHHFAEQGFAMPEGDADGGARHGYQQSESTGWMDFYRDLMIGNVRSEAGPTGIPAAAWRLNSIRSAGA